MTIECPHDVPFGMPSPEALQLATEDICRRYVLPETMQHPQVRSECMRLAYIIQAYGLAAFLSLRSGTEVGLDVAQASWPLRTGGCSEERQTTKPSITHLHERLREGAP
jgi:hypothetical protein